MKEEYITDGKKQIYDICDLMEAKKWIEVKVRCLWCGEFSLLLKEKNHHYWCMNCSAEGPLDEVEQILLQRLMEEKPEVGKGGGV